MKNLRKIPYMLPALFLLVAASSCKNDEPNSGERIDFANLADYCIYDHYTQMTSLNFFDFQLGNKVNKSTYAGTFPYTYVIKDKNTLVVKTDIPSVNYVLSFKNGIIRSIGFEEGGSISDVPPRAIKKTPTNQLLGKTFSGTYYNREGVAIKTDYYYRFDDKALTVSAGTNRNFSRTGPYTSLGNVGAHAIVPNTDIHKEIMILVDGKLQATYYDRDKVEVLNGTFLEVK